MKALSWLRGIRAISEELDIMGRDQMRGQCLIEWIEEWGLKKRKIVESV